MLQKECWWSFFLFRPWVVPSFPAVFLWQNQGFAWNPPMVVAVLADWGNKPIHVLPSGCYFHRHYGIEMFTLTLQGCDISFQILFIFTNKNNLFGFQIWHPNGGSTGNRYIFPTNKASDEVVALHTEASPLLATSPYHAFAAAPPCFLSSFFQAAERFFRFYQIQEEDLQVLLKPFQKTQKLRNSVEFRGWNGG